MKIRVKEAVGIIRRLTPARFWNMLLLRVSYLLSKRLKRAVHWGYPMAISVEPTTSCNLRCPECPSGLRSFTRPTGMLSLEKFRHIIDSLHHHTAYLTLYFQGEPYLNPDFFDMISYAHEKKMYTSTSTNGHFLHEGNVRNTILSGLDKLIISIDGSDQETYEKYRIGGQLEKVLEGTRNLIQYREKAGADRPLVVFQFLVLGTNQHQIDEIRTMGEQYKVDGIEFKSAQIYDYHNGSDLIPDIDRYSRYEKTAMGAYRLKNDYKDQCWRMWSSSVITWDGRIVPCCFDKDASHQLGHLSDNDLRSIWKGEGYREFRERILSSRKSIDICSNCTEGTRAWA